jgi:glutathione synthase/RimK-type ligase-like ATP-grasp enzyme
MSGKGPTRRARCWSMMVRMLLGVAASREFLDLDDSWPPLADALAAEGIAVEVPVWDDSKVDWSRYDLVTVMYAWGYVTQREAFLAWTEAVAAVTGLVNNTAILRWNSDKTYLADLADAGVPVVSTAWVQPGEGWDPPADDYVIKPTVASGGLGAARYRSSLRHVADDHVRRLHDAGQTVMVQPYQAGVDTAGETALVFLGGRFSHAVTKSGLLVADAGETPRLWEREIITPAAVTSRQRQLADTVMATVSARFGPTVYARVDVVDDDGQLRLLEAELLEPSLFLASAEGSAQRVATALAHHTRRTS